MPDYIDESDSEILPCLHEHPENDDGQSYNSVSTNDDSVSTDDSESAWTSVDGEEDTESLNNVEADQESQSPGPDDSIAYPGVCRICLQPDTEDENKCITPCHCCGSMSKVHLNCLEKWLWRSGTDDCEICRFQYTVKRFKKYSLLGSVKAWLTSENTEDEVEELRIDAKLFFLTLVVMSILSYFGFLATDHLLNTDVQDFKHVVARLRLTEVRNCDLTSNQTDFELNAPPNAKDFVDALYRTLTVGAFTAVMCADFFFGFWITWRVQYHAAHWLKFYKTNQQVIVVLKNRPEIDRKYSSCVAPL